LAPVRLSDGNRIEHDDNHCNCSNALIETALHTDATPRACRPTRQSFKVSLGFACLRDFTAAIAFACGAGRREAAHYTKISFLHQR
jgi:hypothetical protein